MIDYSNVDAAIIDRLAVGITTFRTMLDGIPGKRAAEAVAGHPADPMRVLARRLQAMRKKELITFNKAARCWLLAEVANYDRTQTP